MGKILFPDYFPNCIKIGIRDQPDPFNPLSGFTNMTLDQAMGLLWRVKTWECLVSGTYESSYESLTFLGGSYQEMASFDPTNREEDLVCGILNRYRIYTEELFTPLYGDNPPFIIGVTCDFVIGSNDISRDGDVYFPTLSINAVAISSIAYPPYFSNSAGTYNISFLNYVITRDLYFSTYYSGSVTINIRAKEYWSYGGTYDTTTGEPL